MYDSDLTDTEWALIAHHFEPQDSRGTEPWHDKRDVVNAVVYINKTGAQWRMLPNRADA
jgi:putative transposase